MIEDISQMTFDVSCFFQNRTGTSPVKNNFPVFRRYRTGSTYMIENFTALIFKYPGIPIGSVVDWIRIHEG
jgi:hypothetical protein